MDTLSPLNYASAVCKFAINHMVSFGACTTFTYILFGDDQRAITLALILLGLDTFVGTTHALMTRSWKSSEAWRLVPKLIAVTSGFIVGNIFQLFQVEIGTVIEYMIAGAIIFAEGGSVLENAAKIYPQLDFKKVFAKIKKI